MSGPARAPTVVLVRPLGGSMALWGAFGESLAERWRVLAFDPRGVGRSGPLARRSSTRSMARDAVALMDHVGFARAHVFGLSLGGMVATWMAARAPDRVARLVLASTLPRGVSLSGRALARGASFAPCLALPAAEAEVCLVHRVLSPAFRRRAPDDVARIERAVREHPSPRTTLLALLGAAARHDARTVLGEIAAPTLVLAGSRDPLVSRRARNTLCAAIPDARLQVIEGCGHDLTLERPVETAAAVNAFFRGESARHW